jgi:hypothetical protein
LFPTFTGLTELKRVLPKVQNLVEQQVHRHKENKDDSTYDLMSLFLKEIENAENDPKSHFHRMSGGKYLTY